MMKKTGFTLAEVLITLSIIGIVAMMTLPALMTNVQEQQARTGIKKGMNTLTEAAQMSQAIEGFDYSTLSTSAIGENAQSLIGLLTNRTQIDTSKSTISAANPDNLGEGETLGANDVIEPTADSKAVLGAASRSIAVIFFRDGSAVAFQPTNTTVDENDTHNIRAIAADNLPYGFRVVYDINGAKAPNMLSNCQGALGRTAVQGLAGAEDSSDSGMSSDADNVTTAAEDSATNCSRSNRVIKDQFILRLRGAYAQPEGDAATWAFNN